MGADPYILAWRREQARRWGAEGVVGLLRRAFLPVLATAVLIPLVRRTFLRFLDGPAEVWGDGVVEVVFRADLVLLSMVVLDVYERIVRGRDRKVLEIWPVDPAGVVRATLLAAVVERAPLVAFAGVVLLPLALAAGPGPWLGAIGSLAATLLLAAAAGSVGHLLAVKAAISPAAAPYLDLVRGNNPRAQAAFLYAPGGVLLAVGALLRASAAAVPDLAAGEPTGLLVALPLVAAVPCVLALPGLARATWFRASTVLAEIDARYATFEDPEEARRVYLEWMVRFLPAPARVYALDDLRHGWRARRTLVGLGGVLALVALWAGWTADPTGPFRAAAVAVIAALVVAANGVLMDVDEPALLRAWMPRDPRWGSVARAVVLCAWGAPATVLGAVASLARHGGPGALLVVAAGGTALPAAALLAVGCGRLRERGLPVYAPLAAVVGGVWLLAAGAA